MMNMKKKYLIPSANVVKALTLNATLTLESNRGTDDNDPGAKRRGGFYDESDASEKEIWSTDSRF